MLRRAAYSVVVANFFAHAQPADTSLRFEVVSIRPSPLPAGKPMRYGIMGGPGTGDPGLMTFAHVSLGMLVRRAYSVESFELSCPDWFYTERFDLSAKVPEGATKGQVPIMIQNLLIDRFQLKVHREMREMPIYELSVAKGGPKLKLAPPDTPRQEGVSGMPALDKDKFPVIPPGRAGMLSIDGRARWQDPDADIAELAKMLARELGKPVTDATGLKGRYGISLDWIQEDAAAAVTDAEVAGPEIGATDAALGPNIFTALKQQLGLRLEAKKGPAAILVVDSASRVPTEN